MGDTVTFRADEDTARALVVLTKDGTPVSTAVRTALIDAARRRAGATLRAEAAELVADVMFLSPDGKSARMFITHESDPATTEGIGRVDSERKAAQDGLKMSSLSDAKVFLGGTAATYKDMADGTEYDLMIAVVSALTLIFMIMLILTRSAVAALVIVATAASSIAASFGISVLLWQDLFGIQVHWLNMLMSVIILLAVGSDYNLLLVSRFRDEIHAGLKTGIIRSVAGTGGVVTSAGLVFAATMASMMGSKLIILAQMGSTIALGLLVDTLIVRSLLMPSIATLLGRWFWWPQVVYPRGDNHFRKPQPARPLNDDPDTAELPAQVYSAQPSDGV